MSKFEKLINQLIKGDRGCWYFDLDLGTCHIGGGYFGAKCDARRALKRKLDQIITERSVLEEFLELKFGAPL